MGAKQRFAPAQEGGYVVLPPKFIGCEMEGLTDPATPSHHGVAHDGKRFCERLQVFCGVNNGAAKIPIVHSVSAANPFGTNGVANAAPIFGANAGHIFAANRAANAAPIFGANASHSFGANGAAEAAPIIGSDSGQVFVTNAAPIFPFCTPSAQKATVMSGMGKVPEAQKLP